MKKLLVILIGILFFALCVSAQQKGIDTQTQKITENKKINSGSSVGKNISWGKGKTKSREPLANPYRLASKRDILIQTIIDVLETHKLLIDDSASRLQDGIIVTQPFTFAKGAVITQTELNRYAVVPSLDVATWSRGRFSLTIEVQSIDGTLNNVSVNANVEGRTEGLTGAEWTKLRSSGEAEDNFLVALVEAVTGVNVDDQNP
jgi:hypothetical protein